MNLSPDSNVLIQGITEPLASQHAVRMKDYGTNIVAGVSPGEGGTVLHDIPVFDLVEQAVSTLGTIDTSIIFVPPYAALDATLEAIAAGIQEIILITPGIPPLDLIRLFQAAKAAETLILGPSSSGILIPEKILLGTQKTEFYTPGNVGIISRTGLLTYEIAWELTQAGLGQSASISLGRDFMVGSNLHQWLKQLDKDEQTQAIVLIGQIAGLGKETTADYIAEHIDKPVIAYFVGHFVPLDKPLSDPSVTLVDPLSQAITVEQQIAAFKQAKISIAKRPSQIPELVKKALKK